MQSSRWVSARRLALVLGLTASCGRSAAPSVHPDGAAPSDAGAAESGVDAGPDVGASDGAADVGWSPPATPGWTPLRHLTNHEYDRTVFDLLGVAGQAAAFMADDDGDGFDVLPIDQVVNDGRYGQYFDEAERLAAAAFADPVARARIMTCHPATGDGGTCARIILRAFGLRAWRRPLSDDELAGLVALANSAVADGGSFEDGIQLAVTTLLSSAPFLYRLELDPDPSSAAAHALTPFELASRLSYLVWSSMPDDRLFGLAADGTIARADVLRAELDRMLDDARAEGFVERFAGAWLGVDALASHQVDPAVVPPSPDQWPTIQAAMGSEMLLYLGELVHGDRSFTELLDADFNFVNAPLARHYGLPADGLGDRLQRVEVTTDHRRGYLGLGGTLVASSISDHTSPFHRGGWILERLLCQPATPFGGAQDGLSPTPESTFRARVLAADGDQACAGCHAAPDGLGLGLEEFDATGAYRAAYADGTPVDPHGALPDGTPFAGEAELGGLLARDPRFLPCVARQALKYALNRALGAADEPYLAGLVGTWTRGVPSMRALLEQVTASDAFGARRAEGTP